MHNIFKAIFTAMFKAIFKAIYKAIFKARATSYVNGWVQEPLTFHDRVWSEEQSEVCRLLKQQ